MTQKANMGNQFKWWSRELWGPVYHQRHKNLAKTIRIKLIQL